MTEFLEWIARNGGAAFGLAIFSLIIAVIAYQMVSAFFDFLVRVARAFTGKYPPPEPPDMRPIVKCDGNCSCGTPCKCCEENGCQVGCGCASQLDGE
jgi:hypothetical protein